MKETPYDLKSVMMTNPEKINKKIEQSLGKEVTVYTFHGGKNHGRVRDVSDNQVLILDFFKGNLVTLSRNQIEDFIIRGVKE